MLVTSSFNFGDWNIPLRRKICSWARWAPTTVAGDATLPPLELFLLPVLEKPVADNLFARPAPRLQPGPAGITAPASSWFPEIQPEDCFWSAQRPPPVSDRMPHTHSQ